MRWCELYILLFQKDVNIEYGLIQKLVTVKLIFWSCVWVSVWDWGEVGSVAMPPGMTVQGGSFLR